VAVDENADSEQEELRHLLKQLQSEVAEDAADGEA
jgi:hypothetical protein